MSEDSGKSKVHEYMHADIASIDVAATLQEASQAMTEKGVGALLIKEGSRLYWNHFRDTAIERRYSEGTQC